MLDRRRHAFREDLADIRLEGRVSAPRYVAGEPARIALPVAPLRPAPRPSAPVDTECLFGETVQVFERANGWAWIQGDADGYVGYVPMAAIAPGAGPAATHVVSALRAPVLPGPSLKLPGEHGLSLGSPITVVGAEGPWRKLADGGFVHERHIRPAGEPEADPVAVARRFLNLPYVWGGRSCLGIDCSALVQLALLACGIPCPRDTDMQQAELGAVIPWAGGDDGLEPGDLVFWRGHVAFWTGPDRCLHANATDMMVAETPFAETVRHIEAMGEGPVTVVRRPPPPPGKGA